MPDTRMTAAGLAFVPALLLAVSALAEERPWVEIKTPSFTIVTDAGASAGRRTAWRFERIRGALEAALPRASKGERAFTIVAARDEDSLRALVPEWWEHPRGVRPTAVALADRHFPAVVLRVDLPESDEEQERFSQAYWGYVAHLVAHNAPRLPLWAARGLTEFYAHTTVQDKRVLVGRASPYSVQTLKQVGLMATAELLSVDRRSPDYLDARRLERFDAQSWLFVHYLMLGDKGAHRPLMGQLVASLAGGAKPEGAALEVLGDLRALDRALATYLHSRGFYMETHPVMGAETIEMTPERRLSPAEVHALRGTIHLAANRMTDARSQLEEAARLDPDLATAHEALASLAWRQNDRVGAGQEARRAQQLAPDRSLAQEILRELNGVSMVSLRPAAPDLGATERQCEAADLPACARLGEWLIAGQGLTAEPARGMALLDKACDGGQAEACSSLASHLLAGTGATADRARAMTLLEKACSLGQLKECLSLASDFETGEGVPQDTARAARLYQTACDRGEPVGCTALAWSLQTGEHMPKDVQRAVALYENACSLKEGTACVQAGILLFAGDGIAKDLPRAARLFDAGCAANQAAGCANLGTLHKEGLGVPRDPAKARTLFEKACQAGYASACTELKATAARRPARRPARRL